MPVGHLAWIYFVGRLRLASIFMGMKLRGRREVKMSRIALFEGVPRLPSF